MYVSMGWIAAEKKPTKTDAIDAMPESLPESLNVSASNELCEIVCRSSFANVNTVFLISSLSAQSK